MVTKHNIGNASGWVNLIHCLSTDTKPTAAIVNGSTAVEIDTGKVYRYDAQNLAWHEQPTGSGGAQPAAGEVF